MNIDKHTTTIPTSEYNKYSSMQAKYETKIKDLQNMVILKEECLKTEIENKKINIIFHDTRHLWWVGGKISVHSSIKDEKLLEKIENFITAKFYDIKEQKKKLLVQKQQILKLSFYDRLFNWNKVKKILSE